MQSTLFFAQVQLLLVQSPKNEWEFDWDSKFDMNLLIQFFRMLKFKFYAKSFKSMKILFDLAFYLNYLLNIIKVFSNKFFIY